MDHITKARRFLASGDLQVEANFADTASRDAYLAAFHAALPYIVEQGSREPKTHSGTRGEFARLARHDRRIEAHFVAFLARAYEMKTVADYDAVVPVAREDAVQALRMVDMIAALIDAPGA